MSKAFRAACIQTTSGPIVDDNLKASCELIEQAAAAGADIIMTPEVVNVMDMDRKALATKTSQEKDDVTLAAFQEIARKTGKWILAGSVGLKHEIAVDANGHPKFANRSVLINPQGKSVARYDKIHMFDVDLDGGESYRESKAYEPGDTSRLVDLPWGKLGMTICYDLRFPQLYRSLAQAGASFLSIPAAFTRPTGEAHWHILMRARAIENGCYVFAPAQCGHHGGTRYTYGHSLIIDPWGKVLADGGEEPGFIMAEIEPEQVTKARQKVPSLKNGREFTLNQS